MRKKVPRLKKRKELDFVQSSEDRREVGGDVEGIFFGTLAFLLVFFFFSHTNNWFPLNVNIGIFVVGLIINAMFVFGRYLWEKIARKSKMVVWNNGRSSIHISKEFSLINIPCPRDDEGTEIFAIDVSVNGKSQRVPYDFIAISGVGGTTHIIHFPGHNFLIIPFIELPVYNDETQQIEMRDYTFLELNDDTIFVNARCWTPKTHANIPTFMYNAIKDHPRFSRQSRVDVAIEPLLDFWRMGPVSIDIDYQGALEIEAKMSKVAMRRADYSMESSVAHQERLGESLVDRARTSRRRGPPRNFIDKEEED